ncbi:MAG: tetratricopeptide repeat protein [Endomicrobia bacterium]|nr:tetratricopeptide repeat protein [Endomicrobiia bacterium]
MKKYQIAMLIALMFVTVVVFYTALNADFVNLDDRVMVVGNWKIRSLSPENLSELLFKTHFRLYHPLVNLSYAAEYQIMELDPYIYHATNVILHLLNTLFVFFIFRKLSGGDFFVPFITAFIFACHPLHVEPVAWISSRKDTLYAFFFLASLFMYLKSGEQVSKRDKISHYALSMLLFLLACLSKTMAVTLPAIIVLCDWLRGEEFLFDRKTLAKYIPFFIAAAAFAAATYKGYYFPEEKTQASVYSFYMNFIGAHFNFLFYIAKFFVPTKLAVAYPYFFYQNEIPPDFIMKAPALLYGIAVLALYSLKVSKKIFFGFAFFAVSILPVINIFPTGIASVADRYTYIPLTGLAYISAVFIVYIYGKLKGNILKRAYLIVLCALSVAMCANSISQAQVWLSTSNLFGNQIKIYPGQVAQAYATLGVYYGEQGMDKEAERYLTIAYDMEPALSLGIFSLAGVKKKQKKYKEALELYRRVSPHDGNIATAYVNAAQIYLDMKNDKKALELLDTASHFQRDLTDVYVVRGVYYAEKGDYKNAIIDFDSAKKTSPQREDLYLYGGKAYENLGDNYKAALEYSQGIAVLGETENLLMKLGELYFKLGKYVAAESKFRRMIELYPESPQARDHLGSIYAVRGDYKNALVQFTTAVLIDNKFAVSYFHRAAANYEIGHYEKAAEDARRAESLGFKLPDDFKQQLKEAGIVL